MRKSSIRGEDARFSVAPLLWLCEIITAVVFVAFGDIQDIVVVDGKISENGICSQSILFH